MMLAGAHAIVTGGGTGIGAAIARALAAEGAKVSVVGRRLGPLEEVAGEIGGTAISADLSRPEEIDRAFDEARAANGPIKILVNNAGIAPSAPFKRTDSDMWRNVMATNLDAPFHCCKAALGDLLAADAGRIVTIASVAGLEGFAYVAPYVASKHGVVGLMRALAAEYAGTRLTANAVCPGFVDTDIVANAAALIAAKSGMDEEEARAQLARQNKGGTLLSPEDVARVVVELCDPSCNTTGAAITIEDRP
ncbi:SDR family NAD(P)-dependent oxidoreductase [Sphingomicrobium aestuariivivum]|uniref:SDR family NAD(P)-dependent oxidoreductase n=1 Tax=Sphingomicrobium aestuariivivum TaxID=1582356 RepID=UPI001FD6BC92|nr:SDR family oxidoreductase [Sphingomicrobium aestuariivivum]MCJ8191890.1 SDR family oxidoreductase [Sphingomicrobium aestuariivivum]